MSNFITNNLTAKIVAILLAIVVWAYVASGESRIIKVPSIQITAKSAGAGLIAKLSTNEVTIKVSAEKGKLKNITSESFEAYVDLTSKNKGTYLDVPVVVTSKDPNISIRNIEPALITVMLDSAVIKTVPVVVKVEGKPGEGLVPDNPMIEPDKVEVRGAKSDVDKILEATAVVGLKGETSDVKKTVVLQGFDAKSESIKELAFSPTEVVVSIPIIKAGKSKTVGIKVKTDGLVKSGYWASQISVEPNTVSITGNSDTLNSTKFIETGVINIDGLSASKVFNTNLSPPTGIILLDSIDTVRVSLVISAVDTTKAIIASIRSINLGSTLTLDTSASEPVTMLVSGPADRLNTMGSDDIIITLDLGNFAKYIGIAKVDILRSWIAVPEGISVVQFNPSAISIELKTKGS